MFDREAQIVRKIEGLGIVLYLGWAVQYVSWRSMHLTDVRNSESACIGARLADVVGFQVDRYAERSLPLVRSQVEEGRMPTRNQMSWSWK